ncbi:LANO_0E12376g1_1 [Lachancea nothofagi CBS 11611]|uniref:LANO_0E12376g1_1 n=1 Tax=Lachancea nothofagi CBS 11611 TaxID=1266666 RepID=A0A1G4JY25_9SACH|nr:LANO_0E12376g1_1 [Lachancea nothofagi CBS 11611]
MPKDKTEKASSLSFVKEGDADIEVQLLREKQERARLDTDYKTKERLTLQDQLRLNAITKQEEFGALVKDRNSFNRLSSEDIEFYENLRKKADLAHRDMEQFLDRQAREFEQKKVRELAQSKMDSLGRPTRPIDVQKRIKMPAKVSKQKSNTKPGLKGIIKKKHTKTPKPSTESEEGHS